MSSIAEPITCLLLMRAGAAPDQRLRAALAERHLQPELCHDALAVMTELCLRHRARQLAAREPGPAADLLVAVEPQVIEQWVDLRDAVGRYFPQVEILRWTGESLGGGAPDEGERVPISGEEIRMLLERD